MPRQILPFLVAETESFHYFRPVILGMLLSSVCIAKNLTETGWHFSARRMNNEASLTRWFFISLLSFRTAWRGRYTTTWPKRPTSWRSARATCSPSWNKTPAAWKAGGSAS